MPKRNLLKVIHQLDQAKERPSSNPDGSYAADGWWNCSWQGEHGSAGNLDECIEMVSNYILGDFEELFELSPKLIKQRLAQVKHQCLTLGQAGVEDLWSIWYGGDD